LIQTGGLVPRGATSDISTSPRRKGLKQGLFIFLLTFLVVPIVAIFTVAIRVEPYAVAITAVALFMGGLLRIAYALMFESAMPAGIIGEMQGSSQTFLPSRPAVGSLPPQTAYPAQTYAAPQGGNWKDTNDLEPTSITEGTTKLLERDDRA
jgi:hypothetical protein